MDPSGWNAEMDLSISVGLGVGNKAEQIEQANEVLTTMAELQNTPYAWLVDAAKVHTALKRKFNAAGIKNVDDYLVDPEQGRPQQERPDPEAAKAQAEMQLKAVDAQATAQLKAAELQGSQQEAALKLQLMREEAAAKLQLEREKAAAEIALAREKMAAEIQLERERRMMQAAAVGEAEVSLDEPRPGGELDK